MLWCCCKPPAGPITIAGNWSLGTSYYERRGSILNRITPQLTNFIGFPSDAGGNPDELFLGLSLTDIGNQTIPPGSTITGTVPASHVWTVGENFGESIGPTPDLVLRYHPLPLPTSNTPEPLLLDLRTLPATASGPNWSYELTFAHALQMWHDNGPGWFSLRATWPDTGDALGDLLIAPFISTNLTSITYEV